MRVACGVDPPGFESYLADEERQAHRASLDGLDVAQRVLLVDDA
jgi:hypothetical protein